MRPFLLVLLVLFLAYSVACAKELFPKTTDQTTFCCFDKPGFYSGKCLKMTASECKLKQGRAVKHCRQCEKGKNEEKREGQQPVR